ncbi:MAG: hypothetical protein UT91_C0005G0056 [Parcubacteria group bacterium GW2011_GWA2_40_23]|nr:MAG: hypothetical protein UT91_C0005G0056 [Parcubacteria group bacterium GW2011_GWA2_40_23]
MKKELFTNYCYNDNVESPQIEMINHIENKNERVRSSIGCECSHSRSSGVLARTLVRSRDSH